MGLVAMLEAVMGHRQKDPVRRFTLPPLELDPFVQPADCILESSGAVQGGASEFRYAAFVCVADSPFTATSARRTSTSRCASTPGASDPYQAALLAVSGWIVGRSQSRRSERARRS